MKLPVDLKNICGKSTRVRPALNGVYFGNGKIVATDGFKLIEIEAEGEVGIIVPVASLKKGDDVTMDEKQVTITRPKVGKFAFENVISAEEYPNYEVVLERAIMTKGNEVKVNRKYLIDLLSAMPPSDEFDQVTIKIGSSTDAVYIYNGIAKGLLMPINV